MTNSKVCTSCSISKPLVEFERRREGKDGFRGQCKLCRNSRHDPEQVRARSNKWYKENRDRHIATGKAYRAANPEKQRTRAKIYWNSHAEQIRETNRKWAKDNREKHQAMKKAWKKANPERLRVIDNNRRARLIASGGSFTKEDITDLEKRQAGQCAHPWCKASLSDGYHIDHIMPLARGGSNDRKNLQLLCAPCNLSKGSSDPAEYARKYGYRLVNGIDATRLEIAELVEA